jgi:hypothetical protein
LASRSQARYQRVSNSWQEGPASFSSWSRCADLLLNSYGKSRIIPVTATTQKEEQSWSKKATYCDSVATETMSAHSWQSPSSSASSSSPLAPLAALPPAHATTSIVVTTTSPTRPQDPLTPLSEPSNPRPCTTSGMTHRAIGISAPLI